MCCFSFLLLFQRYTAENQPLFVVLQHNSHHRLFILSKMAEKLLSKIHIEHTITDKIRTFTFEIFVFDYNLRLILSNFNKINQIAKYMTCSIFISFRYESFIYACIHFLRSNFFLIKFRNHFNNENILKFWSLLNMRDRMNWSTIHMQRGSVVIFT